MDLNFAHSFLAASGKVQTEADFNFFDWTNIFIHRRRYFKIFLGNSEDQFWGLVLKNILRLFLSKLSLWVISHLYFLRMFLSQSCELLKLVHCLPEPAHYDHF